jgi:hypothetical protein
MCDWIVLTERVNVEDADGAALDESEDVIGHQLK